MAASDVWLSVEEVCDLLGISVSTLEKWRLRRVAPPMKRLPNGRLRVRRGVLDTWMDALDGDEAA